MDEIDKADLDVGGLSLVDVSTENDSLIVDSCFPSCPSFDQQPLGKDASAHKSTENGDVAYAMELDDTLTTLVQSEQLAQPSESLVPERRKVGKCNLRKSLAWDSAFFTGAGVLDPEELSSMMKGVEKSEKNLLPGIEEDVHRSTDSFSTLESESLSLESLEADLFQDIRASIQRSSEASKVATSSSNTVSGETKSRALCSSEKVDLAAHKKMKPSLKKPTIGVQGLGRTDKQNSGCPEVTQFVAGNGHLTSSIAKPANKISRVNSIPAAPSKRASFGVSRIKMETNNLNGAGVVSKGVKAVKPPGLGSTCRIVPKPAPSSKSSSLGLNTTTKVESAKFSSLRNSSASISSDDSYKSPMDSAKRKIVSRVPNPACSVSFSKTPSKIALKNLSQSGKSSVCASPMMSKFSSSSSPASSISDWSSLSSSTTSTVNPRPNMLRASIDSNSSSRSINSDVPTLDLVMHIADEISNGQRNQVKGPVSRNVPKALTRAGSLPGAVVGKPTGLRMPSPKIGFFDGVKSLVRTRSVDMQSPTGLSTGLTRIGSELSSPAAGIIKPKLGKIQLATAVSALKNIKLDTQKIASPVSSALKNIKLDTQKIASPVSSKNRITASTKVSTALRVVKNSPTVSTKVFSKTGSESGLDSGDAVGVKALDTDKHVADLSLDAGKSTSGNVGRMNNKFSSELHQDNDLREIEVPTKGDNCDSSSNCNSEDTTSSQKADVDANHGQHQLKNSLHLHVKNNDQEARSDDQVDDSSNHDGLYPKNLEILKEHTGDSFSPLCVHSPDSKREYTKDFMQQPVHCQEESQVNSPKLSTATSEVTPGSRIPLAVKNSITNSEGLHLLTGSTIEVVEKTVTNPSMESVLKENC